MELICSVHADREKKSFSGRSNIKRNKEFKEKNIMEIRIYFCGTPHFWILDQGQGLRPPTYFI